jgi:hypothetical protein
MLRANLIVSLTLLSTFLLGAEPDPFIGKWKLNWEKCQSPQPRPKSVIRTYRASGDGVRVQENWIHSDGKKQRLDYKANYDGNSYAVNKTVDNTVAFTRSDPYTVEGASKASGKTAYTFKRYVSRDRKTLTIEMTKLDPAGKPSTEVLVYDRVK